MSSLNPYDYFSDAQNQTHSFLIRKWCHGQYNGENQLQDEPDDDASSGQPCEPADEALDDPADGIVNDTGKSERRDDDTTRWRIDPPDVTSDLGGEEDTRQW